VDAIGPSGGRQAGQRSSAAVLGSGFGGFAQPQISGAELQQRPQYQARKQQRQRRVQARNADSKAAAFRKFAE